MKKFLKPILFMATMSAILVSCSDDDDNAPQVPTSDANIVEVALATPDLSSLVAALQRADLVSALEADGNFTVLAPSNAAFDAFLSANGFDSLEDIPIEVLQQVLLNHVIPGTGGALSSSDLLAVGSGYANTLADGPSPDSKITTYFNTTNGVQFNGISTVTTADVGASNGIVHIVDTVIPLPTVVTFATADPNFSTLVTALTELTPATDYVTLLSTPNGETPAPFTVFAPVNAAFDQLAEIPEEDVLTPILSHHVIANMNVRAETIEDGQVSPATFEGDTLTFSVSGNGAVSITDGSGQSNINILLANVQASNGVIHALDTVMMPNMSN